jgi:Tfp pilus assembly protein PilF
MFQTGSLKTTPPGTKPMTAPTARPKPAAPEGEGGATMVFGQSSIAGPKSAAMPSKPAAARSAPGSAMMFGAGTAAAAKPAAAPARPATQRPFPASKPAPAPEPETAESEASTDENDAQDGEEANVEAKADQHAERVSDEGSIHAKGAEERPAAEGAFDKAPPKGLLISVMVGLAVLVLTGGGLVLWKKIAKHGPPPAAVETLATATSAALRDTMASLADAETKANDALDLAGPKSYFPQAVATLARIEIQWSDALNDQASFWTEKGQKAAEAGNDAKKTEAESKVAELQNQAKARLKIAFEKIAPAYRADPKSPDLELALADYYRAQRSNSNMNRELRKAQALKTEEPRIALVQGLAAAQEEDGAEKAISKLKTALNANANSARVHFRLAMAYLAAKDNDNAMKELKETLRISPQHERAKMAMEQLAAAPAEQK